MSIEGLSNIGVYNGHSTDKCRFCGRLIPRGEMYIGSFNAASNYKIFIRVCCRCVDVINYLTKDNSWRISKYK